MPEPLQPVGGVGIPLVVDGLDVYDGGEVAVEGDLTNVTGQVRVRDDLGGRQVTELRLQLCLANHAHSVAFKVQRLNLIQKHLSENFYA